MTLISIHSAIVKPSFGYQLSSEFQKKITDLVASFLVGVDFKIITTKRFIVFSGSFENNFPNPNDHMLFELFARYCDLEDCTWELYFSPSRDPNNKECGILTGKKINVMGGLLRHTLCTSHYDESPYSVECNALAEEAGNLYNGWAKANWQRIVDLSKRIRGAK